MATQPEGEEWKAELTTLKQSVADLTEQLKAVKPADLTEITAALQTLTQELATLKAEMPDSKTAASLAANLETKLAELSATVAALSPPPKNEGVPPVPPNPPDKSRRPWV